MELGEKLKQLLMILSRKKEAIVQHVQRSYKHGQDIAVSLRELKVKDLKTLMPARGQSTERDASANVNEQTVTMVSVHKSN